MTAVADRPQSERPDTPQPDKPEEGMSLLKKLLISTGAVWLAGMIFFIVVLGFKSHKAPAVASQAFEPTDEFKLEPWFKLGAFLNKGVFYIILAAVITIGVMLYMAKRLKQRPGRLQAAIEMYYGLVSGMTKDTMDEGMSRKYFPLIATIFIFILVSNLLGYIPLPVDTDTYSKIHIGSVHLPSFQIFAADTNVAFPLVLALCVFLIFTYEGMKAHGPLGYIKSLMPSGLSGPIKPLVFGIEILSYFLRLISLTVRLWANLLAGHLLIAFMGGELGVLVGDPWVSWMLLPFGIAIFLFEAVLIAGLQAFIFSILTAIYLGSSVESH